ncbi:MAG TPA: diversity-generating retroelement protein Avd [Desulfobacterales bacterium]|nr:diversity-generating retroelement protein Avd [Desulfobacterales bacterium]
MSGQLKIAQKWEDMAVYAYGALRQFPKSERFTLGAELRECLWKGLKLIVKANNELDSEIKTMLALLRVAHGLNIIPPKKYELWAGMLVEIGKMLGGWLKYCRS